MISFKLKKHEYLGDQVEVFNNKDLIATICGDGGIPSLKVISRYIDTADTAVIVDMAGIPPAILIPFTYGR